MPALKECPVILWFESTKSSKIISSHLFNLDLVKFLPVLKEKTGLLKSHFSSFSNILFNLYSAETGQFLFPFISKMSIIFPLNPVVLEYGMCISTSLLSTKFTFSHTRVVAESKLFS